MVPATRREQAIGQTGHAVDRGAAPPRQSLLARLRGIRFQVFVVIASMLAAEAVHWSGAVTPIEHLYSDLWHRASGVRFTPEHVALVVVDDQSLAEHGDVPMVFWTPLFARAAATLREAGATVIGVDFLFGFTPEDWIARLKLSGTDALRDYDLGFRQELNRGRMVLAGSIVRGHPGQPDGLLLAHSDYLLSLPDGDFVNGIGFANLATDGDGGVRRFEVAPPVNLPPDLAAGAPRYTLAPLLAARSAGLDRHSAAWRIAGREIPVEGGGIITYAGPPGTVPRVSLEGTRGERARRSGGAGAAR